MYRILNYTRIKPRSRSPQKKIRKFYAPRLFSSQNKKKSAQITRVNTVYNKMVYSALTQLHYISLLITCFYSYKTIFRPLLTIWKYIQCVHTLGDPIVFT